MRGMLDVTVTNARSFVRRWLRALDAVGGLDDVVAGVDERRPHVLSHARGGLR